MAAELSAIQQIGTAQGATIPKAILERLDLQPVDQVHLIEMDSGILISLYDPDFQPAMQVYEKGMKKYSKALSELTN
ncbi:MAG: AbrB/MazE/SpoVT family DNA-binding domain-containing protein [Leptonema illini]|jgi:putative addiction module antidote|uniref:AbrB/MazE/SpoVT family DNA-binding domain-containing protein n=1 Tax=Leptonema illini TaxID=183 RepID=A0A833GXJ4_9LEPT|nr:MAG: AbrB/MazE/SpoVT family DNA-binding domain-containing protein [Leptonema illini]